MFSRKVMCAFAIMFLSLSLSACDSPEEKEAKYLSRGDSFLQEQDYTRARLEYRNAARISPANPRILYSLGLIDELQGNLRNAMKAFMVAEQQDQNFEPAVLKLAQYFLTAGQDEGARERVDRLLSLNPNNAEARALSASLYLKKKFFRTAKDEVGLAFKHDSNNIIAFSVLTGLHMAQGNPDKALKTVEEGIARNSADISLYLLKAVVYSEQNNIPKVSETYEEMFVLRPDKISLRFDLSKILFDTGHKKEAEATLRTVVSLFPDNMVAKRRLSAFLEEEHGVGLAEKEIRSYIKKAPKRKEMYLWLAELYIRNDLTDQAIIILEDVIKGTSEDGVSLNASTSLANIQLNQGDVVLATKLIDAVLEKDVNNSAALFVRANLSFFQGDYQKAVSDLRIILRDNPNTKTFRVLAEALLIQGYLDLAIDTLMQSLDFAPADRGTNVRLAQFFVLQNDMERARKILSHVTTADPSYKIGWESTARLAIKSEDWAEAERAIQELTSLDEEGLIAIFLHGQVLSGKGQKEAAIKLYKEVIESDPSAPLAEHALSALLSLSKDLDRSSETVDYIASLQTDSPAISTVLGKLFMVLGRDEDAEKAFKAAIEQGTHIQIPFISLSRIFLKRDEIKKALEILDAANKAVPSDDRAMMMKAEILYSRGSITEAINIYDALLEENPALDVVANNLAQIIADFQSSDKSAMEKARLAAERFIASDNPFFLDTLGWVYFRQGNLIQAEPIFERVMTLADPAIPQMQYHYGRLLLETGNKQKAKEMFVQAVNIDKDQHYTGYEEAKELLKSLK